MDSSVKIRLGLLSIVIFTLGILNFLLTPGKQEIPTTVNAQNTRNNGIFTATLTSTSVTERSGSEVRIGIKASIQYSVFGIQGSKPGSGIRI